MKILVTAAILVLAAIPAASAQVYGTNDDPYQQNPFASGMSLPEQPATAAPSTPAAAPVPPPQETGKTQQAMSSSNDSGATAPAKKPAQP